MVKAVPDYLGAALLFLNMTYITFFIVTSNFSVFLFFFMQTYFCVSVKWSYISGYKIFYHENERVMNKNILSIF